jgi:hypothetical protein
MVTEKKAAEIEEAIRSALNQGLDPRNFRLGFARHFGIDVAEIDAVIERSGPVRVVSARTVADERLRQERIDSKAYPAARRFADNEED